MSSCSTQVRPCTSPTTCITSATFVSALRRLSMIASSAFNRFAYARARSAPARVRRHDREVRVVLPREVVDDHRRREQVIHRNVEEPLDLRLVQVHRQHALDARRAHQVRHQLRRDRHAGLVLAVLPRVAVVRHHRRDARRRRALERVGHDAQLDEVLVHRRRRRLNDEDVGAADVLVDLEPDLGVRKPVQPCLPERNAQELGNLLRELRVRASGEDLQLGPVHTWIPSTRRPELRRRSALRIGWGGRIRTSGSGIQSPVPYQLGHAPTPPSLRRACDPRPPTQARRDSCTPRATAVSSWPHAASAGTATGSRTLGVRHPPGHKRAVYTNESPGGNRPAVKRRPSVNARTPAGSAAGCVSPAGSRPAGGQLPDRHPRGESNRPKTTDPLPVIAANRARDHRRRRAESRRSPDAGRPLPAPSRCGTLPGCATASRGGPLGSPGPNLLSLVAPSVGLGASRRRRAAARERLPLEPRPASGREHVAPPQAEHRAADEEERDVRADAAGGRADPRVVVAEPPEPRHGSQRGGRVAAAAAQPGRRRNALLDADPHAPTPRRPWRTRPTTSRTALAQRLASPAGTAGSSHVTSSGPRMRLDRDDVVQGERLEHRRDVVIPVRPDAQHPEVEVDLGVGAKSHVRESRGLPSHARAGSMPGVPPTTSARHPRGRPPRRPPPRGFVHADVPEGELERQRRGRRGVLQPDGSRQSVGGVRVVAGVERVEAAPRRHAPRDHPRRALHLSQEGGRAPASEA